MTIANSQNVREANGQQGGDLAAGVLGDTAATFSGVAAIHNAFTGTDWITGSALSSFQQGEQFSMGVAQVAGWGMLGVNVAPSVGNALGAVWNDTSAGIPMPGWAGEPVVPSYTNGGGTLGSWALNLEPEAASGLPANEAINHGILGANSGFQDIVSERFPFGENGLAADKGYPGIGRTAEGGPDFAGTDYLYPAAEGQLNSVTIKLTGSYTDDFDLANAQAGFTDGTPKGYTWHHVDDFDPTTSLATLQLVQRDAHVATYPHIGGVAQYEGYYNVEYGK